MIRLLCFFLVFFPLSAQAQFTYTLDQSIPVQDIQGKDLSLAWAGGLNAAQFNTMDLNGDGTDDLVLFDRMANKVITFVAYDQRYLPAPEFEDFFPADVYNWILLRDYNCDGKKDLFTGDVLGMKVYTNTGSVSGRPEWEPHLFNTGFPGAKSQVLLTEGLNGKVNLQLQFDDLPSISDVDGDGDLDIMNIQYAGHTVEFHRNLSVENNQPCDSMDFVRVTRSWGNFRECHCEQFAFNNESCPPNTGGRTKHAGGKSLLVIDVNGDHVQDLVFSEAECNQLYALINKGTVDNPIIDAASVFPPSSPVNFVLFPAAFYEDVDFDGKKDLISSPNIFSKQFLNSNLSESIWFYKNTGSASNPVFSFVERNFLQGDMIDVGDNAVPAFSDYDRDGDFDMLISSHSSEEYTSRIFLFANIGSPTAPAFKLASDDYLGFTSSRLFNLKIQLIDINSDQTQDLVFTATSFDNNTTNLYYLSNKSQSSLDFTGSTVHMLDFGLTSTENVYLADINGDGLPDILAGRSEGNLEYWKNTGVAGSPNFTLEQETYLGFGSSTSRQNAMVAIADLDADGTADLVIGDQTGKAGVISDFRNAMDGEAEMDRNIVYNAASKSYQEKNLGGKIWPTVVNLFATNKPAVVFGNALGGVHILRHDEGSSLPEQPEVHLFPNPVLRNETLSVAADRHGTMEIISVLGQQLSTPVVLRANEIYKYALPPLAAGLYLLKFTSNKRSHVQRFIVQ
jgi:hypothetical protein